MSKEKDTKRFATVKSIGKSLFKYVLVIVAICALLVLLGVDVTAIFASLGVVALIVGFGAESLIADMVTGLFLMIESQYKVGDIIEVDGFRGEVVDIGIRTTSIKDGGDNIKIVNNSQMVNILNRSNKSSRAVTDIGIAYEENLLEVEAKISEILDEIWKKHQEQQETILENKPEYKGVQALSESAVVLRFVAEVSEQNVFGGTRYLNRELLVAFQEANIKIPYAQIEIHSK